MRGALKPRDKRTMSEEAETTLDLPPVTVPDTLGPQETEEPAVETPVESNAETETPAVTLEPAPEAAPTRPSRVTKKPIRFNDYECYPCSSELPTTGEVTVSENGEKKSAWSRPGGSPQTGHSRSGTGSKEAVGGSPWSIVPTLIREDADRLSTQEWPELPQERQDIKEPVRSRLPGLPPEIPGRMTREASSQATTCKKQFGSRTNGSLRISNQNSELFYEAQEFPQEVRDETGTMWSFTEKADSVNVPGRTSKNNLAEKDFEFGHLHSTKMEKGAEDTRDSTDGESDSSLLLALQELSSCVGEAAVGASQHSEWSEQALLSEPDLAVKGALKAAAQVVPQTTNITETNSQNWLESVIEKKSKGDKPETETHLADEINSSVLKVTEEMQICTLSSNAVAVTVPRNIVPYKEMPRELITPQKTGIDRPATPVRTPAVLLDVVEDYDWLKDFCSSNESDQEAQAVDKQCPSSPSTPAVLKVTEVSEVNQSPSVTEKPDQHVKQPRGLNSSDDSPALKVAGSRSIRGKGSPALREMCSVSRIRASSPIADERLQGDGRRIATISPIRPPKEKRLRLELNRIEPADYQAPVKSAETVTGSVPARKRIPTTEWVSRRTKDAIERAVHDGQGCKLCNFTTSRRRIRIHVRQHFCLHYCHCGFQHISRDQVAEHQRQIRRSDHARSKCQIHMVDEGQFSIFRKEMGWPAKRTFGPLLPTVKNLHQAAGSPRLSTSSVKIRDECAKTLTPGYRIPKRSRVDSAPETASRSTESPASPPVVPEAPKAPSPGGEGMGKRRWRTTTEPRIEVVEVGALTPLESLLERRPPSSDIPGLRARRAATLEADADRLEDQAREIDVIRRKRRCSHRKETLLRDEAYRLRTEATRIRQLLDSFTLN